jgi:hypothetical protein
VPAAVAEPEPARATGPDAAPERAREAELDEALDAALALAPEPELAAASLLSESVSRAVVAQAARGEAAVASALRAQSSSVFDGKAWTPLCAAPASSSRVELRQLSSAAVVAAASALAAEVLLP